MGRAGDDDPVKPSDLSEAEREALKRQYRGVFWDRKTKRWRCQLGYQSKKIFLGYFDDAGEAARAYDQKLVELRGAGARTNFPITEYLDMMPTPTKRGGGAGAAAVAAAAAAAANREGQGMDEDGDEDDGEEIDQPAPSGRNGTATAAGYGAETPSLDPEYSAGPGGRIGGLLDMPNSSAGLGGYAGGSVSPRHGLSHLPAIAPLSTELPGEQQHAALAAQDYDMAGDEDLAAAAQLAIEIRRSFDGGSYKWQQQHHHHHQHHYAAGGVPQQLATATSTGSAGGSAAAAAAAGYAGRGSELDLHQRVQQQQPMGTYGDDTAAAAAAGYGGNASLYGSYGHHHPAAAAHHHHQQQQQQQHYVQQHHGHLRNGSTPGDLYGSNHGWADPAAAAAAAGGYEGHAAFAAHGSSHYPHHAGQHHSHSGVAGSHGGFSDSGGAFGGYPAPHQHHSHHAAAAAAAAAGYGHHAHHAHYQQQQQQAQHYQHQMYHQQQQVTGAGFYPGDGEEQHMAAAGHIQQQQQHYHGDHPHQQQQQHGHFPLHHSHSYPGAVGHEGMDGAAAAGYYPGAAGGPTYATHAQAVAAQQHRLSHAHSSGHFPAHHAALQQHHEQQFAASGPHSRSRGDLVSAQGVYGSSGDLQQHYGGGLAAAQQHPVQQQQQYDARAAASNPAVAAADYRQRLVTYGLHGYAACDAGEYGGGAGMDAEQQHRGYAGNHMQQHYQQQQQEQQQQQHMQTEADLTGVTAMDAAGPGGTNDPYSGQAAYETEDPWIQSRGFGRGSAAGSEGGLADVAAGGEGLPAVKTTRTSGRTSRATNRAAAAAVDSDDYDIDDDDDNGSDSDTGRGRGRNGRRRSRAAAAAGGQSNGDSVLRTKQRTDTADEERGHSYRGVFWDKKSRRWRCQLGHKNKKIFLGYFGVAEDAARAYDQKLVELHGGSAKTNFPIQNYLGGGTVAGSKDNSAAAESPKAPGGPHGGADVPGRRRSSYAGDASAKAGQAQQQSELSWGALGLPRSARLSHDASEGAPRLSWAGVDTLSSWDQQDPDSQYAKRRRLMEGGGQLPTSPQEFGALTGGMHGSHQAVGGEDMISPTAAMARQSSGYRVVETPSVLTAGLAGRHSSSGQAGSGSLPTPAPSFDAAAMAAGILPSQQQQQQIALAAAGRNNSALARLASGEVGAVQALSGLHVLGGRSNSGPPGLLAAAAGAAVGAGGLERANSGVPALGGSAAANAVLAAAGAAAGGMLGAGAAQQQQQQQSHASRLFDEAVHQYGSGRASGSGLPPVSAVAVGGRVSDPNTGASSSTATPPSAITAGGHFGHGNTAASPVNAQAALSRLNSSEVRAVQALSGIHDALPYQNRGPGPSFGQIQQQQQQQHGYMAGSQQGVPPSPASITETVAKELLCRAPVVSAVASSSIAAVAAAAAAAAAAKGPAADAAAAAAAAARNSADGSFSGLVGEMAAGLGGDGRLRAVTPPSALNPERLKTPGLSPLLTSSMLLPPPPPLQLQLDGQTDLGDSLPGTASAAAAAAAAAVGIANAGKDPAAAAAKLLSHIDPGDAFAAEAGWGGSLEDLLMPKKRPSCSGNSGLIGLIENIGQFKHEADAAAAAVAVPQQQQQEAVAEASAEAAGSDANVYGKQQQDQEQPEAAAAAAAAAAQAVPPAPAVTPAKHQQSVPAAAAALSAGMVAAAAAAMPGPGQGLPSASVSFMTPTAEPMAVLP